MNFNHFCSPQVITDESKNCEIKLFEKGIKNFQQLKTKKQTKAATSIRKWLNMTTTEMLKSVVLFPNGL